MTFEYFNLIIGLLSRLVVSLDVLKYEYRGTRDHSKGSNSIKKFTKTY